MSQTDVKITYIANAGVLIGNGNVNILIDGLHTKPVEGFSPVPVEVCGMIMQKKGAMKQIDFMLFTHCHEDHCDIDAVSNYQNESTKIFVPGKAIENIRCENRLKLNIEGKYQDENVEVAVIKSEHAGDKQFSATEHVSFLLKFQDMTILVMGDSEIGDGKLLGSLKDEEIDVVCINFIEINREKGRAFLSQLRPNRIIMNHIPFVEDDKYKMRESALRSIDRFGAQLPTIYPCLVSMEEFVIKE